MVKGRCPCSRSSCPGDDALGRSATEAGRPFSQVDFLAGDRQIPGVFATFQRSSSRETQSKDCMAVDAVYGEPLSVCIFPGNMEICRVFGLVRAVPAAQRIRQVARQSLVTQVERHYADIQNRELLKQEQGIHALLTGNDFASGGIVGAMIPC
jgi:hypothetical protein